METTYMNMALLVATIVAFYAGYLFSQKSTSSNIKNDIIPNFIDDRSEQNTKSPVGDSFPGRFCPNRLPNTPRYPSGCMVGCNPCYPLCSGEPNRCLITAPVPSPAWQPQSASTVQYRLRSGNYVPAYCKQGSFALQKAPSCGNLENIRDSKEPKKVTCYTARHL
jgi:hypothetical protein